GGRRRHGGEGLSDRQSGGSGRTRQIVRAGRRVNGADGVSADIHVERQRDVREAERVRAAQVYRRQGGVGVGVLEGDDAGRRVDAADRGGRHVAGVGDGASINGGGLRRRAEVHAGAGRRDGLGDV